MKSSATDPSSISLRQQRTPPAATAITVLLLGLVAGFCVMLWPEWRHNPDLSHGMFAPLIFLLLVRESRRNGPQCWLRAARVWPGRVLFFAVLLGVALFALAGLLAASLAWNHALVSFVLAAALCCFLFGGLLLLADERMRVVPFSWISLTAIFLWLLVSPLPSGTYARLTLGLQGWVTGAVLQALHLFGVPARQHGNIIELATTSVGVEEACSGIRSLLSCIYAGFFFAAWQLRRPGGRLVLIIAAPLLALGMNFVRSLVLTLMANAGRDITGFWHDVTGFAVLGITAVALAVLAILLETPPEPPGPDTLAAKTGAPAGSLRLFWTALVATLALGVFYFVNSRPPANAGKPVPDLAALLPENPAGWEVITPKNLYQFSEILQTTHLLERTYLRTGADGKLVQVTVYVAYWLPGEASVSRVASHTPDACWPGAGWSVRPVTDSRQIQRFPDLRLGAAEHRLFQNPGGLAQHVWFWHVYAGHSINYRDPYSVPALVRLAWQYGFRRQGDQYFIRVSSNQPWAELTGEPLVQEIFARLAQAGL